MKIIIKTLKGQQLPLEVEEDMKVRGSSFLSDITLKISTRFAYGLFVPRFQI